MSVGLLDVNMLVALAWPAHVHHNRAHAWFSANHAAGWATCPMTQCGFVRVSCNARLIERPVQPREALTALHEILSVAGHVFWPDDISLLQSPLPTRTLLGHKQVTDAYLLGLSIRHKGKLVTMDRGVAALLPSGSPHRDALEIWK